jgi:hypothetical protein
MNDIRKAGPAVKRLSALIALALVALITSGCGLLAQPEATPVPAPEVTAEPTPVPTPTPAPTPVPTPVPVVEIKDYQYARVTNKALDVTFVYPSHWINKPGAITISYIQPVEPGETAARLAVSVKKSSKSLDQDGVKKELDKMIDAVASGVEDFRRGSISKKVKLAGNTGLSIVYQGNLDGKPIKGFLIVAVKNSKKRLKALNFYAPADLYSDFEPVLKQVLGAVKIS